jgi:membrane-associated phospholipid phosphatase
MQDVQTRIDANSRVIWGLIALMAATDLLAYHAAGLGVDFHGSFRAFFILPLIVAVSCYYRYWRLDRWIATGAESCAQIASILLLGMMLTYPLATLAFPYQDPALHAMDTWLGLDWQAYLDFFNASHALGLLSKAAYCSMQLQYPLVILALTASSRFLRLQQYTIAIVIALAITLLIFTFVPALDPYAYLRVPSDHYANLNPTMTFEHIRHLEAMRTKSWSVIRDMEGLISFPSFHTISAILFSWALFPIGKLRWWVLGLNTVLIASTPVQGAHYFIDVLGGALVAAVAILAAPLLMRAFERFAEKSRPAAWQQGLDVNAAE